MNLFGYPVGPTIARTIGCEPTTILERIVYKILPEAWYCKLFGDFPEYRGLVLLKRILPDSEFARLLRNGFFYVQGSSGTQYRVSASLVFNVEDTETWDEYCAAPDVGVYGTYVIPIMDTLAAQALCLMNCEAEFFRVANRKPEFFLVANYRQRLVSD